MRRCKGAAEVWANAERSVDQATATIGVLPQYGRWVSRSPQELLHRGSARMDTDRAAALRWAVVDHVLFREKESAAPDAALQARQSI